MQQSAPAASAQATLSDRLLDSDRAAAIELHASFQAAVLVALRDRDGSLSTVFTRRHRNLPRHAGEISFPGGRREPRDATLIGTALRETHEEIGLPASMVQILGALEPVPTVVSDHAVYPFVGLVPSDFSWHTSPEEVEAVIEFTLPDLVRARTRTYIRRGGLPIRADSYVIGEHVIWGATARILSDLLARVYRPGPTPRAPRA